MQSDDPDFEPKAADVIGLYINPPDHAAVFAVDEKTAIQALDRLDPVLPLSPGRAERHGFEYDRHGTRRSSPRSIPSRARCSGRRCRGTPAPPLSTSSARWWPVSHRGARSTSSPTISRPIKPKPCAPSCWRIRTCGCISRRLIRRGSTKSNCGFRNRAGPPGARHLYLRRRPGSQNSSLYPSLQQSTEADPLGVSKSGASN